MYDKDIEFYDIMSKNVYRRHKHIFGNLLDIIGESGTIVDIGAGTGNISLFLARKIPKAKIVAIEPSVGMRIAFMSKLSLFEDLKKRITIYPKNIIEFKFPYKIKATIMVGVIGHLTKVERDYLWEQLYNHMDYNSPIIITNLNKKNYEIKEGTRFGSECIGDYIYELDMIKKDKCKEFIKWSFELISISQLNGNVGNKLRYDLMWYELSNSDIVKELLEHGFDSEIIYDDIILALKS